MTFFFGRSN